MRMGCHSARSSREEWRRRRSPKIEHDLESRSYSGEHDRFQDDLSRWAVLSHRRGAVFAGINRGPQGRDSLTGRASPSPPPSPASTSSRSSGPEGGGRGPLRLRLKTPWVQPGKAEETHPLSPHHPLRCATTACTRQLSLGCVPAPMVCRCGSGCASRRCWVTTLSWRPKSLTES